MRTNLELRPFAYQTLCAKGQVFADQVFARFPATKKNAFMFQDKDGAWNPSLWLKSPKGEERDIEFFVDQASGEAFRWTAYYSAHLSDFGDRGFDEVDAILSDRRILCVSILGGQWKASLLIDPDNQSRLEEFVEKYQTTVAVYSFSGGRDRSILGD